MARDWEQIAADFQQKYQGTFCRYLSPMTGKKEVFQINAVVFRDGPPDIHLFHPEYGEIYLKYDSDCDLDFSFPEVGYFQHKDKALLFTRRFQRQWKKGVCDATASADWPYYNLYPLYKWNIDCPILENAYKERKLLSLKDGRKALNDGDSISVVLSPVFSLGLGKDKGTHWLWFEDCPIGEVTDEAIRLHVPVFRQELDDYMRDTKHYDRVIQNT